MDKDATSSSSGSTGGNGLPSPDFLSVLEMFEEMREIEPHHNCFTKELLSHRSPGEGSIIFYLTDVDGNIQASITFLNRDEDWNSEAMYYQADLDLRSPLFENVFSKGDYEDVREIFSDTFLVVMPKPEPMSFKLRISSDKGLRSTDSYPATREQRETGIQLTLTTVRRVTDYFQNLENGQYHIDKLKESLQI